MSAAWAIISVIERPGKFSGSVGSKTPVIAANPKTAARTSSAVAGSTDGNGAAVVGLGTRGGDGEGPTLGVEHEATHEIRRVKAGASLRVALIGELEYDPGWPQIARSPAESGAPDLGDAPSLGRYFASFFSIAYKRFAALRSSWAFATRCPFFAERNASAASLMAERTSVTSRFVATLIHLLHSHGYRQLQGKPSRSRTLV